VPLDTPAVIPACDVVDLDEFVAEFGDCAVQERDPREFWDFHLRGLGRFYEEARREIPTWSLDRHHSRYVFHDNLIAANDPQTAERLDEFFDRHQPTDEFVALSRRQPCVAIRFALGGPDSGTPTAHVHGPTQCLLLAGQKRWWLWPPQAELVIAWIVRGGRARNPLEYWMTHIAPIFGDRTGDVTEHFFASIDELTRRDLFQPRTLGRRADVDSRIFGHLQRLATERSGILAEDYLPWQVTQRAGEIVFLPESWSHAVRNDDWSLAVIYELCRERAAPRTR